MTESTDLIALAGLVVTFVLAQAGLFLDQRRRGKSADARQDVTDAKIDDVATNADIAVVEASLAAEYARPVAADFTTRVLEGQRQMSTKLDTVITEVREVRHRLDEHLGDHASSDLRRG